MNADYVNAIKKYMEMNEIKQNRLAELLQVSEGSITNWMNGRPISEKHKARIRALCSQPASNPMFTDFSAIDQGLTQPIQSKQISKCKYYIDILAILDDIMASDMCQDCKIKAYNIIKARRQG